MWTKYDARNNSRSMKTPEAKDIFYFPNGGIQSMYQLQPITIIFNREQDPICPSLNRESLSAKWVTIQTTPI